MDKNTRIIDLTIHDIEAIIEYCLYRTLSDLFKKSVRFEDGDTPTIDNHPEFVDKKTAAKMLACSPGTIDNMARSGRLGRYYVGNKAVRFKSADVLSLAKGK